MNKLITFFVIMLLLGTGVFFLNLISASTPDQSETTPYSTPEAAPDLLASLAELCTAFRDWNSSLASLIFEIQKLAMNGASLWIQCLMGLFYQAIIVLCAVGLFAITTGFRLYDRFL